MSARSFPQLFLLSLLNLLLLAGCAVKGSVRLDPREPKQLIFESEVLVSEDLDPPAVPKPEAPDVPAEQEQKHPDTSVDDTAFLLENLRASAVAPKRVRGNANDDSTEASAT